MKTKRKRAIIAAAVVLVLASAWLWYTRPMTLERLCPGINLSQCTEIRASCTPPNSNNKLSISLTPEDAEFGSLMAQFQGRTFRRSVRGLLSGGGGSHTGWSPKDTNWDVHLHFDDAVPLPNGEEIKGDLIWFSNFYGSVDLRYAGYLTLNKISTSDKQQWLADIQALLSAQ